MGAVPPMVGADPLPPAGSPREEPETAPALAPAVVAPAPPPPPNPTPPAPDACDGADDDDADAMSGPPAALMDSRPRLVAAIPTPPPPKPWPLKWRSCQANAAANAASYGHLALWQINVEHRAGAPLSHRCHASRTTWHAHSRSRSRHTADAPARSDKLLLATPGR
nr:vegetative cell wall protein gp1-like [Drosophila takahashii]